MADKSFSDKLEAFGTLGVAPMAAANVAKPPPISPQERELAQVICIAKSPVATH
jgi:hypothetical protein